MIPIIEVTIIIIVKTITLMMIMTKIIKRIEEEQ